MNRLLGYVVTFLLIFVLFDVVLRIAGCGPQPKVVEFNSELGWANKKDQTVHRSTSEFKVDYALNSHRMRGPEVGYEKPANVKRVLFIGDSFTLGFTVTEDDSFVRVCEKGLRDNGHAVQALNGGTEGYSTDQELVFLQSEGIKFRPDVVVFAPYLNDVFWNTQDKYTVRGKPKFELKNGGLENVNALIPAPANPSWFREHTAIGNLVDLYEKGKTVPRTTYDGRSVTLEDAPLLASAPAQIAEAWTVTDAIVKRIADVCRESGAKPVALLVPNKWEVDASFDPPQTLGGLDRESMNPAAPTDHFKEVCTAAGFVVVDPRPALVAKSTAGTHCYFTKDFHWNAEGNHVAAHELRLRLEQPDLLGAGTGVANDDLAHDEDKKPIPTWAWVVGTLFVVLGTFYWRSYPRENPVVAYGKVAALIAGVAGIFFLIGKLAGALPHSAARFVMPLILIGLLLFIVIKIGKRFGVITELYGTFLRRGHWYMLPMLVVMLSIGMLLVVAASSPFVAPFIYTLF